MLRERAQFHWTPSGPSSHVAKIKTNWNLSGGGDEGIGGDGCGVRVVEVVTWC